MSTVIFVFVLKKELIAIKYWRNISNYIAIYLLLLTLFFFCSFYLYCYLNYSTKYNLIFIAACLTYKGIISLYNILVLKKKKNFITSNLIKQIGIEKEEINYNLFHLKLIDRLNEKSRKKKKKSALTTKTTIKQKF